MHENYTAEIKFLTQFLLDHPESLLFARLAERYLRMNEVDKALEICLRGLRNHPDYATGHLVLAKCYLARKQYEEAEKRLKHVYTLENNYLNAYKLYGELMGMLGRKELQYAAFKQIKKIDPLAPIELPVIEKPAPEPAPYVEEVEPPITTTREIKEKVVFEPPIVEQPPHPVTPPYETDATLSKEQPVIKKAIESERSQLPIIHIPEEEEIIPDFSSAALFEERPKEFFETEEELEIPSPVVQPKPRVELSESMKPAGMEITESEETDFEKEEERFSLLLDDLFRPNLDDEEQREKDARSRLEKAAQFEPPIQRPQPVDSSRPKPFEPQAKIRSVEPPAKSPTMGEQRPPATAPQPPPKIDQGQGRIPPASGQGSSQRSSDQQRPDYRDNIEEQEPSPLPTFGPDFSIYPHKEEDEEIREFIDHLERMGKDREEQIRQEETFSAFTAEQAAPRDDTPAEAGGERTKEKFVTPTLGEIYAAQGQYAKAISVFEMLLKKNPDNEWYRQKLEYLRKRLQEEKKD